MPAASQFLADFFPYPRLHLNIAAIKRRFREDKVKPGDRITATVYDGDSKLHKVHVVEKTDEDSKSKSEDPGRLFYSSTASTLRFESGRATSCPGAAAGPSVP